MTAAPAPAGKGGSWTSAAGQVSRVATPLERPRCHYCLRFIRPGEPFSRPRLSPRHAVRLCVCQACGTTYPIAGVWDYPAVAHQGHGHRCGGSVAATTGARPEHNYMSTCSCESSTIRTSRGRDARR
jgi:hypothetical protein